METAATVLGVHYQTVYRWVRDGTLPAVKVGSVYEVRATDVERLRHARARPSPPPRQATVRDWPRQDDRLRAAVLSGDEGVEQEHWTPFCPSTDRLMYTSDLPRYHNCSATARRWRVRRWWWRWCHRVPLSSSTWMK